MQLEPQHADRLALDHVRGRGKTHIGRVHDGDAAAALDLDVLIGSDEGGRVFIESNADGEGVVCQGGNQPSHPVSLAEMLVDDETVGQPQTRRQPHTAGNDRGAFIAKGDHMLAQDAGPGAGAPHRHAVGVTHANQFCHRCAAEQRGEAQLIAAGKEDAAGLFDPRQAPGFLAIPAGVEIHHRDPGRSETLE